MTLTIDKIRERLITTRETRYGYRLSFVNTEKIIMNFYCDFILPNYFDTFLLYQTVKTFNVCS